MADAVPVCNVLCEAMEYLSKLGMNLKVRTDNLKEKKIRKEKLTNTHAVQKAANKVLAICELSKKSLENVETGVKNLLQQIGSAQGSGRYSAYNACYESDSDKTFEYFEFESKQLKIRKKIFLKHYTSVKVVAKTIPLNLLENYPVYYDCSLYQLKKKRISDKPKNEKEMNDDHNENSTKTKHLADNCDGNSSPLKICEIMDAGTMESVNNDNDIVNANSTPPLDNYPDLSTQIDFSTNQSPKAFEEFDENVIDVASNITIESDNCLYENDVSIDTESNLIHKNNNQSKLKEQIYEHFKNLDDSSIANTEEYDTPVLDDDQGSIKLNNENDTGEKSDENCTNFKNDVTGSVIISENKEKNDFPSESNEIKRSFIKCVNINKLLEVPEKEKDVRVKSIHKGNKISKEKNVQRLKKTDEKKCKKTMNVTNNSKIRNQSHKINKNNSSDNTLDQILGKAKRKEVKLFKPKEFSINLFRLPNFSEKFLKKHDLKKITQSASTVFELKSCIKECEGADKTNSADAILEHNENDGVDGNLKHNDNCSPHSADIGFIKRSLTNDSNYSKTTDMDLAEVAESIKNALLNDSNSDTESDKGNNRILHVGSTVEKSESSNVIHNSAEQNKSASDCNNSHVENNENAENMSLPSDDILISSLQKNTLSDHNGDPEKIKSLLLNDSSDGSSNNKKDENEKDKIVEDQKKVKDSLLYDYSDSSPNKSQKRKRESDTDSPCKSKRKQLMESMHAKKMLLTYSSSSDTDDPQLRDVFKEIKESLLKGVTSDEGEGEEKTEANNKSVSDSENDFAPILRKDLKKSNKISSSTSEDENDIEIFNRKKKRKHLSKKEEFSSKIDDSKAKRGSRSSQNSDSQDANDKEIDGLTNLNTLSKSHRRRRSSTEQIEASAESKESKEEKMPKAQRIKTENLLKAETSSDAASIADSEEGEDLKDTSELPSVSMSILNGDEIAHLAKDDLLQDSDSSSSNEDKLQEDSKKSDTDVDENIKSKRRKGNAISSDSEAGSSRRRERGHKLSDFEDSDDEGSEPSGNKKRKKKPAESDDNSSVDSSKKKRRRIKNIDDSDASGSDTENEGRNKHGRKNIRKVMGKNQLEEATKKAAREEKERIARIAERQKVYNNLEFDESGKPDEVILEKVVLDFDPETKEPLIEVDRGLVKKLKPHQANGIKFMWDACFESVKRIKKDKGSGCILAHCMGLGKTLQVVSLTHTLLTHSDLTGVNRVLVVCPLSTVLNWVNEFRIWLKHTEKEYDVDVYELSRYKQNSERAFQLQHWFENGGVCVLGYEMFRNLSADNPKKFKKKMLKNFQESLVDPGPDLVVCDEGHLLKNEKTSLSQSMNRVKTLRRIVLTGTPLQNNLKEYYCMVQFVKPNLLGKYNEYLNRFVNPITNGQYTDSTEHDIRVMKRRSHVLHKMLDGAVQRRDYGVLAPFLPPKHEYVLFITLTEVQIKLYQHYLDNYSRRPLPGKSSGFLFPDFQSLQRIWTHPLVLKYNSERYEIMQQKKREREEEDSEGSLVDFIDDDSTPEESTSEESSEDYSDVSDDSRKKSKKKKSTKKGKVKDSKVTTRRGTRANPVEQLEEDVKPLEVLETKYENPTEWWIKLMSDDELEDMRNSAKLVLLFDILRQCETIGDKLLVFSQSLYSLDLIEHFLGKVDEASQEGRIDEKLGGHVGSWSPGLDYFRLDGSTSCENRSIWCKNFNREDNPRARLFLISTRAGGLGINLVAANRVVIFDVSWNPSHDVQSIFRVYRFGQKKPCYIYRFLAMGTMEEKIYERQVTKQAISKRVIDEQQIDRHYAENDLAELYKFSPRPPTPRPLPSLPRDRLFAEMLREHDALIYKYHEHDSLLENKEEETLSEEERKAAWEDFENEKNRPPPAPFPAAWQMPNGMVPGLLAQHQQLAFSALANMLRKDMPNITENQIREMLPLIYSSNPGMFGGYDYGYLQKMSDIFKYAQPGMMNAGMINPVLTAGGGGAGSLGGASGLQYEPPWQRQQQQQQQMRLQQLLQQQHQSMGAKYYAGGLGSRDPVAMALQQQRAREIMLGERSRPRGRPPLHRTPPTSDIVNLADSD